MGSRIMPTDCFQCGGIQDWGDFGPDENDSRVGACGCVVPFRKALDTLLVMYGHHHEGVESDEETMQTDAIYWVMDEVWLLRSENRDLRIMSRASERLHDGQPNSWKNIRG